MIHHTLPKLVVMVPVLNEEGNLPRLFRAFESLQQQYRQDFKVSFVMIDDGSTDRTAEVVRSLAGGLDLHLLVHEKNKGPGRAFATGFAHLENQLHDQDWVVTMEGDNTSRLELLGQMLTRAQEGFDVILASPYLYGGSIVNTNTFRKLLSTLANLFVKEFLALHGIATVSSFFRAIRGGVLRRLQQVYSPGIIELAGFEGVVEMLMKMTHLGITISEVPMILDSSQRIGKSKMKVFRTMLRYFSLYTRQKRWRTIAGQAVSAMPVSPIQNGRAA